jgi:hypothetical protein
VKEVRKCRKCNRRVTESKDTIPVEAAEVLDANYDPHHVCDACSFLSFIDSLSARSRMHEASAD